MGCDLVFGADLNAAASILLRCSKKKGLLQNHYFATGPSFCNRTQVQCSAEVSSASTTVFAPGENTCTAHQRRPPVENNVIPQV